MPTAPTPLPTIPPFPALADRATGTYNSKAYGWATGWKDDIAPAIEALADNAYDNAVEGAASAAAAAASAALSAQATGTAIGFTFDTATADADPGAGKLRLNNATQNTATVIRADNTSSAGSDVAALLATFGNGTSAVKGRLRIQKATNATKWLIFDVTAVASPSGYKNITASCTASSAASPFADGDALAVSFVATGDKGDTGATGPAGTFGGTANSTAELLTGANIASASTVNLNTATGNRVHITGTTTITAWTLTRGPRTVIFDGALQLTYHATTNRLNSNGANVTVAAGDMAYIESDGTTVYVEVIKANGSAVVGVQTFGTAGAAQVIASAPSNNIIAICQLSSTRALVLYCNANQFPQIALVDQTGAKVSGHTPIQLEAVAGNDINVQIIKIDATTAVVAWGSGGTAVKAAHLTVSGSTVTAGALCTVSAENGNSVALCMLTSTKFVAVYVKSGTDSLAARTLTLSGTTLTANTAYTLETSLGGQAYFRIAGMSATQVQVAFNMPSQPTRVRGTVLTEASNVLTFPTPVNLLSTGSGSSQIAKCELVGVSASRALLIAGDSGVNGGMGYAAVVDMAGTGSSATQQLGAQTIIAPGDGAVGHRAVGLSAATYLHASSSNGSPSLYLDAFYIDGDAVRRGAASSVARTTGGYDVCVMDSTTALVAYVDSSNSNYPTVKPVALGTVS